MGKEHAQCRRHGGREHAQWRRRACGAACTEAGTHAQWTLHFHISQDEEASPSYKGQGLPARGLYPPKLGSASQRLSHLPHTHPTPGQRVTPTGEHIFKSITAGDTGALQPVPIAVSREMCDIKKHGFDHPEGNADTGHMHSILSGYVTATPGSGIYVVQFSPPCLLHVPRQSTSLLETVIRPTATLWVSSAVNAFMET